MVDKKLLLIIELPVRIQILIDDDHLLKMVLNNIEGVFTLQREVTSDDFGEYKRLDQQRDHIYKLQSEHVVQ
jgi:hypothetical protein